MEISKNVKGYMKTFLLTEQEAYFAMLVAAGANTGEAYCVVFDKISMSKESSHVVASRMIQRKQGITDLINSLRNVNLKGAELDGELPKKRGRKSKEVDENDFDPTNKDSIIGILTKQLKDSTSPKEKAYIAMNIAELQQMKKDENKEDAKLVHFYVPITCKRCSLYVKEVERRKKEEKSKNK